MWVSCSETSTSSKEFLSNKINCKFLSKPNLFYITVNSDDELQEQCYILIIPIFVWLLKMFNMKWMFVENNLFHLFLCYRHADLPMFKLNVYRTVYYIFADTTAVKVLEKKDPQAGNTAKLKYLMALASLQQHPSTTHECRQIVMIIIYKNRTQKSQDKNKGCMLKKALVKHVKLTGNLLARFGTGRKADWLKYQSN